MFTTPSAVLPYSSTDLHEILLCGTTGTVLIQQRAFSGEMNGMRIGSRTTPNKPASDQHIFDKTLTYQRTEDPAGDFISSQASAKAFMLGQAIITEVLAREPQPPMSKDYLPPNDRMTVVKVLSKLQTNLQDLTRQCKTDALDGAYVMPTDYSIIMPAADKAKTASQPAPTL